ncbi:MAG: EAL domain-containing protein [Acidobacteriota bacterium]|nr:EAL domain-containing protein [Acidobacteriota bacterium]
MVTVAVIVSEFLLLTYIYDRPIPVRNQVATASRLEGQLGQSASEPAGQLKAVLEGGIIALSHSGSGASDLSRLRQVASQLPAGPAPVSAQPAQAAAAQLVAGLAQRQRRIDTRAKVDFAVLLLVASGAWMIWFHRLVARHRRLQDRITGQEARMEGDRRLAALVQNSADAVFICDLDLVISFATPSARLVTGYEAAALVGRDLGALVVEADAPTFRQRLSSLSDGSETRISVSLEHADGRHVNAEGTVANLTGDPAVGGLVVTLRDVTDRVKLEQELRRQAFHDSLTSLANRQLFADRLAHALTRSERTGSQLVVLFCDLDEFKNVNDSLGHSAGDQVLVEIARRAKDALRSSDTIARLGGDEFAILLEDTDLAVAHGIATKLLDTIARPMTVDGNEITIRASIGLAGNDGSATTNEDLLRNADVAMYLAKDRGKGTTAVYQPQLHAAALERLQVRAELQRAIRNDELVLHYQPTVELRSGQVSGFEALVRWSHPARGLLGPGEFIPVAEQSGLIHPLGSWVLRQACEAAARMFPKAPAGRRLTMSVNVATPQLGRRDFVDEVMSVLSDSGLPPAQLTLEITESALLRDLDLIVHRLEALRGAGVRISIDDFGTGYSSLAYLRNLPVDILKVDKAFVDRLTTDSKDAALTSAILAMSSSLNLATVAEGVEDSSQAKWLSDARCQYGQGYLWSRPVPFDQAQELLRQNGSAVTADAAATHSRARAAS